MNQTAVPVPYLREDRRSVDLYSKPDHYLDNPDAIVIGSGIGGLGVASLFAQRKGWRVLVLEGQPVPGGCTHVHEVPGFEFPSGIDSIGDMDPSVGRGVFRPTIDYITGNQLQWEKMPDAHEVCTFGDDPEYTWYSHHEKNVAWVRERFGDSDAEAVRRYYELEAKVEKWALPWTVSKIMPNWLPLWFRKGFYKLFGGAWRKYMLRSTRHVLSDELGMSDQCASVFCYMYGNHGATPAESPFSFHAANLFHYRYGAYYPVGGPGQIAQCIVPIVEKAGGQVAVSSKVKQIVVENNRAVGVELEDGTVIRSKRVISDASAFTTFMELLPKDVCERHGYPEKFKQIKPSPAHLYLVVGYDEEIPLRKDIIWQLPSYDIDTADAAYKANQDFSKMGTYLLAPSSRDPSHSQRYPGKSTVVALAEAPYEWIRRCEDDPEYRATFEAALRTRLFESVYRFFPELRDKTPAYSRVGVPMGCNPYAWEHCSLGLEPSGPRFTDHNHWLRPRTAVKGLWLTGCDSFSAGFAGSMFSSRVTYAAMTGNWPFLARKGVGTFP
jgi:phytoene dehydrogenase-like protein